LNLLDLIKTDPENILGKQVFQRFTSLPFLLKILDVRQMLSIQVHPSKESAEIEFDKENKKGIPLNAANRNYKDQNHKPELMVALGDFWLLHGFKEQHVLLKTLDNIPELGFLKEIFQKGGYKALYEEVMQMDQNRVTANLKPLLTRLLPLYANDKLEKTQEDFWAARAALTFCADGDCDRGIFSIYFFNLVHLKKGQGIYQPAGLPHAYLEGQNVELMANSDNVLRAGLTDKYVDVQELMKHVRFEATRPDIIYPDPSLQHIKFETAAKEFELHQYFVEGEKKTNAGGPEIWFVLEGMVNIKTKDQEMQLQKGESVFVPAGIRFLLKTPAGANIFIAKVPPVKT
jgi:mannose-6-phosphate isomerase